MIKISEAVRKILFNDEVAFESARVGILNLSAYAEKIRPDVENYTMKEVRTGSIVVSLSRIIPEVISMQGFRPDVKIEDLRIKSPLYELSFTKTKNLLNQLKELSIFSTEENDFYVMTQGLTEVTIICSGDIKNRLVDNIKEEPRSTFNDLVAISVRFAEEYLKVPNTIHTLVSKLATKRINVIEIVSTYTELTFIIEKKDLNKAVEAMS